MQETPVLSLDGEDVLGKSNGNPLQYCLGNSMDRGAWWATVHGVKKESDTPEQLTLHYYKGGKWIPIRGRIVCILSVYYIKRRCYSLFSIANNM